MKSKFYLLTPFQKQLLLIQEMNLTNVAYNLTVNFHLKKNIQDDLIKNILEKIIKRHTILRTRYVKHEGNFYQEVLDQIEIGYEYFNLTEKSLLDIYHVFDQPFNLLFDPFIRIGFVYQTHQIKHILINIHHINYDADSIDIISREFRDLYLGKSLPEVTKQYSDYSIWFHSAENNRLIKEAETFWQREFANYQASMKLPFDFQRPKFQNFCGAEHITYFEAKMLESIINCAQRNRMTPFMFLFATFALFLSKVASSKEVVIGIPISLRQNKTFKNTVGFFANTLPVKIVVDSQLFVKKFLKIVQSRLFEVNDNALYPFNTIVEKTVESRDLSHNALFDVCFSFFDRRGEVILEDNFIEKISYYNRGSCFDYSATFQIFSDKIEVSYKYATKLFKRSTIERLAVYYQNLLQFILDHPDSLISDLEMITKTDKEIILNQFNDTQKDFPHNQSITDLFEEQATLLPNKIAVQMGYEMLSYRDLNEKANCLAALLLKNGIVKGEIVGLLTPRSIEMIIGMVAVLKIGVAYLPIEPDYPLQRIDHMLTDCNVHFLLTTKEIAMDLNKTGNMKIVLLDEPYFPDKAFGNRINKSLPEDLAFIMYTSGTTGLSKGVMIVQKNVVRLVKNTNYVPLNQDTRILQTSAFVFDASTFEIWGALLNGGTLVLESNDVLLNNQNLDEALKKNRINTLWLTKALFNQLISQKSDMFQTLQYLLVGGDVLSPDKINLARHFNPTLEVINCYGPTENTTFSTSYPIKKDYEHSIPIGSPISNSSCYILDSAMKLVPIGISGELYVGGSGVAKGYLNQPELTKEKFLENPFRKGEKIYRTGDFARWQPDGNIDFLGRIDNQVKIRGFRVELGEIRNTLLKIDKIIDAEVVVYETDQQEKYLFAYYVSREKIVEKSVKYQLRKKLPDYMIPTYFVALEKIPLNKNGKVDLNKLPILGKKSVKQLIKPHNETEEKLATIWAAILHINQTVISIDESFFELGGHSLKIMELINQIHENFNCSITILDLKEHITIEKMALLINRKVTGSKNKPANFEDFII